MTLLFLVCMVGSAHSEQETTRVQNEFKILSYNVLRGFQRHDEKVKTDFVDWVSQVDPDVIAFQEMNGFTDESLAVFARRYAHPHSVLLKEQGFPVAITSKTPIQHIKRVTGGMHHGLLKASIHGVTVIVVHLAPPNPNQNREKRKKEVAVLLDNVEDAARRGPVIILGDYNDLSKRDARFYAPSGMWKTDYGAGVYSATGEMEQAGLLDLIAFFHSDFHYTYPTEAWRNRTLKRTGRIQQHADRYIRRIDYAWANGNMKEYVVFADTIRDEFTEKLSDHYPLLVRINLP